MSKLRNLLTFVRSCICDRSMRSSDRAGNSLADGVTIWSSALCRACHLRSDQEIRQSLLEVTDGIRVLGSNWRSRERQSARFLGNALITSITITFATMQP
jgi:hypothetical protein